MTILQLKCLITVAQFMKITEASRQLGITQSFVSKQISSLEKELGISLFYRTTHTLSLTPECVDILPYAEKIMNEYAKLETTSISCQKFPEQKLLTIYSIPVLPQYGIIDKIIQFGNDNPDISIHISEGSVPETLISVDHQDADLGIVRTKNLKDNIYNIYPFLEDKYVILVNKHHPLANLKEVTMDLFIRDKFLLMNDKYYLPFYKEIMQEISPYLDITYTRMRLTTIKTYIQKNLYVTLLPSQMACYPSLSGMRAIPIKNSPSFHMAMITKKGIDIPYKCRELIDYIMKEYKNYSPHMNDTCS